MHVCRFVARYNHLEVILQAQGLYRQNYSEQVYLVTDVIPVNMAQENENIKIFAADIDAYISFALLF